MIVGMDTRIELPVIELPVLGEESGERADAARNRARILCTAERLFAERGASCVSMDEIAEQAGVGKGTLFRRFGSRAALALAVLSDRESAFQEALIRGEPPLGPGASPAERLIAFGHGRIDLLAEHAEVLAAAEVGPARLYSPPYAFYRLHVTLLLREADPALRRRAARRGAARRARRRLLRVPRRGARHAARAPQGRLATAGRRAGAAGAGEPALLT